MDINNFKSSVNQFLNSKTVTTLSNDGKEKEVCDMQTGECYVLRSKDGIVERLNKKFITEDGRQLLQD